MTKLQELNEYVDGLIIFFEEQRINNDYPKTQLNKLIKAALEEEIERHSVEFAKYLNPSVSIFKYEEMFLEYKQTRNNYDKEQI